MIRLLFCVSRVLFIAYVILCLCVHAIAAKDVAQADISNTIKAKIGCLYPLTGPGGLYGRDSVIAIQMAQDYLQSQTEISYPELDILIEDTRSKSLRSLQISRKFVDEDRVDFLCGVVSSGIALNVSRLAEEEDVFFIGTDHASPSLVSEAWHPYYFRVNNGTRLSMLAGAKYIGSHFAKDEDVLKIAFIGPDYDYGYQAWDDLRRFLKDQNIKTQIVGEFWPKLFETDYTTYIQALKKSQADIIVNGHWGLDLMTFVKQANQFGLFEEAQFMNFDAGGNYEVLAELGNDMPLGLVLSARHHVSWPPTQRNKNFVSEFFEKAGRYPSYAAQGAYTGIIAIAEAVYQAGGVDDKAALRRSFESLTLSLPEDPDGFQSYMDPETHQMMQVQAIGRTEFNNQFPPAKVQLGDWSIYYPPKIWPK